MGVAEKFSRELRSFFILCLVNLVFGSLAMAFGLQFIVTAVLATAEAGTFEWFPLFQILLGWAAAVVGFRWILSSARILKGVNAIRREYRAMEKPVSPEALTGLIVRMMGHYRENWNAIWRMNLISTLGGCIFLALGVVNIIEGIQWWYSPFPGEIIYLPTVSPLIFAAGIDLAIGVVSLLFSALFRRYSRAWDRRLIEADRSGDALKQTLEKE